MSLSKLQFKHLTPYLPYKVLVRCEVGNTWNHKNEIMTISNLVHYEKQKMYLRPLSDLTKEIEHNGKKFVPIHELGFKDDYDLAIELFFTDELDSLPYMIIKKLYEWHFDIDGLINQNLAIDINTLK